MSKKWLSYIENKNTRNLSKGRERWKLIRHINLFGGKKIKNAAYVVTRKQYLSFSYSKLNFAWLLYLWPFSISGQEFNWFHIFTWVMRNNTSLTRCWNCSWHLIFFSRMLNNNESFVVHLDLDWKWNTYQLLNMITIWNSGEMIALTHLLNEISF